MTKNKLARAVLLYLSTGLVWGACMRLLFITSGAQHILASSRYQSSKFLKVFMEYTPLPRMAIDDMLVWKGFFICGLLAATAFMAVNNYNKSNWLQRGATFGSIHWALMIPWFEFYLPYNVMNEPIALVLFEALLWLCTLLITGIYMSFIMNFGVAEPAKSRVIPLKIQKEKLHHS